VKALALDFDGVISDSAPEAFLVGLRAYAGLRPGSRIAIEWGRLATDRAAPTRAGVEAHPLYAGFVERMPLGNRAEDFGVILSVLERGASVPDQAAYDRERRAEPQEFLSAYHRRFYEVREDLSREHPEAWRRLMPPYARLLGVLRRRAGDVTLAIATAKDRRSVGLLLEDYGAADLFAEERVLDKETGTSKRAHLERLQEMTRLPPAEITFVDDKVNHLDTVAPLGVRCALAAWGYNGPREHRLASRRGYRVCTLDDVEAQLFGR
jgi:phosphoglycolate phosphatase-like HAD superfamily hydrolase